MKFGIGKKIIILSIICLGGISLLSSCEDDGDTSQVLGFYLLSENINYSDAKKMKLDELPLRSNPWLSLDDIEMYDSSGGCLHLTREIEMPVKQIDLRGTPFVICINKKPIRMGAFWTPISSFAPIGEQLILHKSLSPGCKDLLNIRLLSPEINEDESLSAPDPIKTVLKRSGKLHKGITCQLDDVQVIPSGDTSTVRYTYTITNEDKDNLYILDPDKVPHDDFHAMQNGLVGFSDTDRHAPIYRPDDTRYTRSIPCPEVDPDWFTLIESSKSKTWTVDLKRVYPEIAPGKYSCTFQLGSPYFYHGATGPIEKKQRIRKDGRLWLGQLRVEKIIEVK